MLMPCDTNAVDWKAHFQNHCSQMPLKEIAIILLPHSQILDNFSQQLPTLKKKNQGAAGWLSCLSIPVLVLAQVMISRFVGSSPTFGSVPTDSVSALDSVCVCLSVPPLLMLSLSLSLSKINI